MGKAYARFEARKVATLNGEGDSEQWVRDLAHVTRRHPQEWAERRDVSIKQEITVTVTPPQLTERQQANLARLLADDEPKLASPPPRLAPPSTGRPAN